ncbi:MAG: hypothetical protein EP318_06560 [Rhodobacteraceae bacterium]|nr:MAG: hypothetical protein EP318_06560 [Paracoccaceae bacterium]
MPEPGGPRPARGAARRQALIRLAVLSLPFVLALLYGLWSLDRADSRYGRLEAYGVETRATILSKRVVRRGTDRPRHAYEMTIGFTVGDRMRRGTVEVTRGFHDRHDPPERVPIRYLPEDPQIREIDPAMRDKTRHGTFTIIGILLFVGVANIFMAGGASTGRRRKEQGS